MEWADRVLEALADEHLRIDFGVGEPDLRTLVLTASGFRAERLLRAVC